MEEIIQILNELNSEIIVLVEKNLDSQLQIIYNSVLCNYIIKQLSGTNLLEFNKKINFYKIIIDILENLITPNTPQVFIDNIYYAGIDIKNEIKSVLDNDIASQAIASTTNAEKISLLDIYLIYFTVFDNYEKRAILKTNINDKNAENVDLKKYIELVDKNKFGNFDLTKEHRFFKYKDSNINPKTLLRIVSEISSLKKNLPKNWDTSVIMRVSKQNINMLSFIIIGPKDTPYENGLFEFHAYFPDKYPNIVPKVLINTTGDGRVRFNPNLYNCGKVCLSLLGTWSGDKGESWNPDLSTFLQVIISIQSLIMVENPYFNEPGWEREMHTEKGKRKSFEYNDNIRLQNIKVAMIGMINDRDKPHMETYKEFIEQHFILKKEEIYSTIEKWIDESSKKKKEMIQAFLELKKIYSSL